VSRAIARGEFSASLRSDYVDVDFEFPEETGESLTQDVLVYHRSELPLINNFKTDKENYVSLIKELREGLDKLESASPKLVSIAISAVPAKITAGLSKDLGQYLDYINVMAYVSHTLVLAVRSHFVEAHRVAHFRTSWVIGKTSTRTPLL